MNLEGEDDAPDIQGNVWNFVIPIGVLIVLAIVGGELFLAVIAAIAICLLLYVPQRIMSCLLYTSYMQLISYLLFRGMSRGMEQHITLILSNLQGILISFSGKV